jgi:hypothetical protein
MASMKIAVPNFSSSDELYDWMDTLIYKNGVFNKDIVDPETGDWIADAGSSISDLLDRESAEHSQLDAHRAERKAMFALTDIEVANEEPYVEPPTFEETFEVVYDEDTIGDMLIDYDPEEIRDYDLDLNLPIQLVANSGKCPTVEEEELAKKWIREWNKNFKESGAKIDHYYINVAQDSPIIELSTTFWK